MGVFKKKFISLVLGLLAALILSTGMGWAAGNEAIPTDEMKTQMAKVKELGTPGADHAALKAFVGDWTVTSKSQMKPDEKEQLSTGTSSLSWTLDGRFLTQNYKGDWAGEPFAGVGYFGFDKMKKEHVSLWMDNMSTGIFQSTGQYNPATKTITYTGNFNCPLTGETNKWFRAEWMVVDSDTHVYNMYVKDAAGKEFKSMELTYKRVK